MGQRLLCATRSAMTVFQKQKIPAVDALDRMLGLSWIWTCWESSFKLSAFLLPPSYARFPAGGSLLLVRRRKKKGSSAVSMVQTHPQEQQIHSVGVPAVCWPFWNLTYSPPAPRKQQQPTCWEVWVAALPLLASHFYIQPNPKCKHKSHCVPPIR